MSEKHKKLVSNSLLFTLGSLGSKLISFVLVPIYTFHISKSDYGKIDLLITIASLLLPIVSLSLYDGILRFAVDQKEDSLPLLKSTLKINIIGIIILFALYFMIEFIIDLDSYYIYMVALVSIQTIYTTLAQYSKAIGQVKLYSLIGILLTVFIAVSSLILIIVFKMGITGYMISYIFSYFFVTILLLTLIKNSKKLFSVKSADVGFVNQVIRYSMPLIPNAILWWIISASSKVFIVNYHDYDMNGLYAVANKIPTILTVFTYIFTQAWQLSAIEESGSSTKNEFFTEIFSYYKSVMFIGSSIIIASLIPFYKYFISHDYYISIYIVPYLLIAVIFSSFAGFFGTNYLTLKNTKGVFITSVIAGLLSLVLNFILIPKYGAIGASISTLICYLALWLIRIIDTRKDIKIKFSGIKILILTSILFIQSLVIRFETYGLAISLFLVSVVLVLEFPEIKKFLHMINEIKKRKSE